MDLGTWTILISIVLPAIISVVVKPGWSNQVKLLAAFVICFIFATVQIYVSGDCDFANMPRTLTKVFVLVMGSYSIFWRPTGLAQKIENNVNS